MTRHEVTLMFSILGTITTLAQGTPPALIPRPAALRTLPGVTSPKYVLVARHEAADLLPIGQDLAAGLAALTGLSYPAPLLFDDPSQTPAPTSQPPGARIIRLMLDPQVGPQPEAYVLRVSGGNVQIVAAAPPGLRHGVQTLLQLVQPLTGNPDLLSPEQRRNSETGAAAHPPDDPFSCWGVPNVEITDAPRYRWRGLLLDCGRHFVPKDVILRYIDLLALHKLNVLHWHLTEDQGWRIEIRKHPRLTEVGAWRAATRATERLRNASGQYGGFYTQADVREVVAYAARRGITVVPEIELPGHCRAALACYPELSCTGGPFEVATAWGIHEDVYCAGNDRVFEFLADVLGEVLELFPSEYIHIGGDEVPKTRWKTCPKCQARLRSEGLKDEAELQSWFIRRIEQFLHARGRRLIGWDEILEGGLAPRATVQSWRGMEGAIAAARAGHDVIASPLSHCYINFPSEPEATMPEWMAVLPLDKVYAFEPTPPELTPAEAAHVLGVQANLWTEHAPPERLDPLAFPRLCALAEVGWSAPGQRDWADFQRRLAAHYPRLERLGVRYFVPRPVCALVGADGTPIPLPLTNPPAAERATPLPASGLMLTLAGPLGRGEIRYTLDGTDPGPNAALYERPLRIDRQTTLKARVFLPTGNHSDVAEFRFAETVESPAQASRQPPAE